MPGKATTTEIISPRDLAWSLATRAWGSESGHQPTGLAAPSRHLGSKRRAKLEAAQAAIGRTTPEAAWEALLTDQAATYQFDPARVHPSWFVRLFEVESPAVQWVVARTAPVPIRDVLERRCGDRLAALDPRDGLLRPTGPPHPVALALAEAYWTERLVGDRAASPHDPPVVVALTRLGSIALVRLLRVMGQAKQAFGLRTAGPTANDEEQARCRPADRVRVAYFRRTLGRVEPRLADAARRDFGAVAAGRRRRYAAAGLVTVARLLGEVDPHRARWAVQHLPYPIAQTLGGLGRAEPEALGISWRAIIAWETWIVEASWSRLLREGRLGIDSASAGGQR